MTIDLKELFIDNEALDQKSVMALLKAIKNNHDEKTFDYIKFRQSVSALLKLGMDEVTSYKSAFATASTMGLTVDSLVKSAKKYTYVLQNEKDSFAQAFQNQVDKKIEGRKNEVEKLEKKIQDHKNKIKELEREIAIFQNRIDTVDQDVEAANNKINEASSNFMEVYKTLHESIEKDIDSIKTYL
ncbi:MAG: hypothetical protein HKN67_02740 [Saprospiraceae bacterium]|nr:hypothetical protein [Bacteroidia bacterium]MBT8230931.1 hypothetical protein [Bacteroidia bacterium]NNF20833.1 hypothetical protein [Saprospiraceae bacterium]NNK90541.1 hypothetical protein [Saprospiraceae bacterium]